MPPTETLLITGFLGAGKTTFLSSLLAHRPPGARWAVLVNEFGALGVDRALLGGGTGIDGHDGAAGTLAVVEVAGGCACCAARVAFSATLTRLLRRGPWHRLFIETTGLGHPAELMDQLRAPALRAHLELRAPIAVVDASRAALYRDPARPGHETARDQVALARLVVLNRAGTVAEGALREFGDTLASLPPWPRAVITTATGAVPLAELLDALARVDEPAFAGSVSASREGGVPIDAASPADRMALEPRAPTELPTLAAPPTRTEPRPPVAPSEPLRWTRVEPDAASAGWRWPADVAFDRARLHAALDALVAPDGPLRACGLLRGKGVFHTERAWYAWQWVDDRTDWAETAWRADNRMEVLAERSIDPQMVDQALRTAVAKG